MGLPPRGRSAGRSVHPHVLGRLGSLLSGIAGAGKLEDLLTCVSDAGLELLDASSISISRYEADSGVVRTLRNAGDLAADELERPTDEIYPLSDYPKLWQLVEKLQLWTLAADDDGVDVQEVKLLSSIGKQVAMACPIQTGRRLWGELYATRAELRPFDESDTAMAQVLAEAFALGVGGLTSAEDLRRLAYLDSLTGLGNRRRADEFLAESLTAGHQVVLALCDVDGLKAVNDRSGHAAGDNLLLGISMLLSEAAATLQDSVVARIGGDEFAFVAVDSDPVRVADVLQRVIHRAAEFEPPAGLSCGMVSSADLLVPPRSADSLFHQADAALYRAKHAVGGVLVQHQPVLNLSFHPERVRQLDESEQSTLERLGSIAGFVVHQIDGASWWVSVAPPGSDQLITSARAVTREGQGDGSQATPVGSIFELNDYPATVEACRGGWFYSHLHDPDADPAEASLLAELGYTGILAVGATDALGRRWLVEIYLDELSSAAGAHGQWLSDQVIEVAEAQPQTREHSVGRNR
jgi:diguanylate cyclase (GGDEF)-like protein